LEPGRVAVEALVFVEWPATLEVVVAERLDVLLGVRVEAFGLDGEVAAEVLEQHSGHVEVLLRGGGREGVVITVSLCRWSRLDVCRGRDVYRGQTPSCPSERPLRTGVELVILDEVRHAGDGSEDRV